MFRITRQPVNLRYIATHVKIDTFLSEQSLYIIKIAEFGIKHGYLVAMEAFNIGKSTYYHYRKLYVQYKEYLNTSKIQDTRLKNSYLHDFSIVI